MPATACTIGAQLEERILSIFADRIREGFFDGAGRDVKPMAARLTRPSKHRGRCRQIDRRQLDSLSAIEIDIGDIAGSMSEDQSDIGVAIEVRKVCGIGNEVRPSLKGWALLAFDDRHRFPLAAMIVVDRLHRIERAHGPPPSTRSSGYSARMRATTAWLKRSERSRSFHSRMGE